MKKFAMLAALAVLWLAVSVMVVMSFGAGVAWGGTGDIVRQADGTYYNIATHQKVTATGEVSVGEYLRDRDLDFNVTNLVSSVAIDTGGTGGANFRYSAPVDVRQYSTGRIVIHITAASAADTVGRYIYGVTVFPLTSATMEWAAIGVPLSTNPNPAITDTLGFKGALALDGITANAIQTFPGERAVVLFTDRTTSNYANINAGQTVSLSWDVWLGQGAKPRYLGVQVRLMNKNYSAAAHADIPSVRVDLEGLR